MAQVMPEQRDRHKSRGPPECIGVDRGAQLHPVTGLQLGYQVAHDMIQNPYVIPASGVLLQHAHKVALICTDQRGQSPPAGVDGQLQVWVLAAAVCHESELVHGVKLGQSGTRYS